MNIKCIIYPTENPSCRFYAINEDGTRKKVHVDGDVDLKAVAKELGCKASDVQDAYANPSHS